MTNFADLITRVSDELDRSDLNIQIDRELRRAVEHFEKQRWWFNETTTTTTATSSQASFSPPADLLILDQLEVVHGSRPHKLNEYSWDRFVDEWRPATTSGGVPSDFAWRNDQVFLGPIPSQDYPLVWHYVKTLYPQSFTDGTENAWTNYGYDLLTSRTLKTIGGRVLQSSDNQLLVWAALEKEAYFSLLGMNDQKMTTGKARPWSG